MGDQAATTKVSAYEDKLREVNAKSTHVEMELGLCLAKIERAELLLAVLGWDRDDSAVLAREREGKSVTLVGDVLTSAALIAYLGPFSPVYR